MVKRIFISLALFFIPFSVFADNFVFPVPKGTIDVVNGYGGSSTHISAKAKYSLDFQYLDSDQPTKEGFTEKCYTLGMPILAAKDGEVVLKYIKGAYPDDYAYGHFVYILHDDGNYAWYAHMIENSLTVKVGDKVKKGQILGLAGATGQTGGTSCIWSNDFSDKTDHVAPHLHFEINTAKKIGVNPEPLQGKEAYTNIQVKKYESTTMMVDPYSYWGKFAGRVPYKLNYNPTKIYSFSPLSAVVGIEQVFTIEGENLFDELQVVLPGCRNIKWIKRSGNLQQFSCVFSKINSSAEEKPGFIRYSSGSSKDVDFMIKVLQKDTVYSPEIKKVNIEANTGGKKARFKISGENLPGDLIPENNDCTSIEYFTIKPNFLDFACQLPITVKNQEGKRANGIHTFHTDLISKTTGFIYSVSFSADYEVQIKSMSPVGVVYDQESQFIFHGKNLHLASAFWIENCDGMKELEHTEERIRLSCTPHKPYNNALSHILPQSIQKSIYRVIIKDVPKGTILFSGGVFVGDSALNLSFQPQPLDTFLSEDIITMPATDEEIIEYILKANGNYSDSFLNSVGWKKEGEELKLLDE